MVAKSSFPKPVRFILYSFYPFGLAMRWGWWQSLPFRKQCSSSYILYILLGWLATWGHPPHGLKKVIFLCVYFSVTCWQCHPPSCFFIHHSSSALRAVLLSLLGKKRHQAWGSALPQRWRESESETVNLCGSCASKEHITSRDFSVCWSLTQMSHDCNVTTELCARVP